MTRSKPSISNSTHTQSTSKVGKGTLSKSRAPLSSKALLEEDKSAADQPLFNWPVTSLRWTPDGKRLVLLGRDAYCLCDVSFQFKSGVKEQRAELFVVHDNVEESNIFKFGNNLAQNDENSFDINSNTKNDISVDNF